jgi:hypothetical protein
MALERKISRWNYDRSVERTKPLARQWTHATGELFRELYLAKEFLTGQKGQRKDPAKENYIRYSWEGYCKDIGIPKWTANNFLKRFTPREISATGKDILLLDAPEKEDTTAKIALRESRIIRALRKGEIPDDFTKEETAELKRRMKEAQLEEWVEKYKAPSIAVAKDYFSDAMRRSKDIVSFKLDTREQVQAQITAFRYIEAYLATFDDPETRARAAFNLALKTRNLVNELAEQNFQLSESVEGEGAE